MQIASSPLTAEPTIPTPGMRIAIEIHRKITVMLLIRAPKALIPVRERYHRRIHPPCRHNHHIQQVAVRPNARPGRHTDVVEEGDVELVVILRGVGLLVLHNMNPAPPRREPAYRLPAPPRREPAYRLPARSHVLGATAPGMHPPRAVVPAHGFVARIVAEGPHAVLHDGRRPGGAVPTRKRSLVKQRVTELELAFHW